MEPLQFETVIHDLTPSDYARIDELVAGLPEWFDEHAHSISIPIDIFDTNCER